MQLIFINFLRGGGGFWKMTKAEMKIYFARCICFVLCKPKTTNKKKLHITSIRGGFELEKKNLKETYTLHLPH